MRSSRTLTTVGFIALSSVAASMLACSEPVSPTRHDIGAADPTSPSIVSEVDVASPLTRQSQAPLLPEWVSNPEEFPHGLMGQNNCTFALGAVGAQWDFHSDGACWERPGSNDWTRQQLHHVHVPHFAACGGAAGDTSSIRVCRTPGEPNPCPLDATTGPNGCARCVISFTCH